MSQINNFRVYHGLNYSSNFLFIVFVYVLIESLTSMYVKIQLKKLSLW